MRQFLSNEQRPSQQECLLSKTKENHLNWNAEAIFRYPFSSAIDISMSRKS